jgi:hypothetical protein
VSPNDRSVYVAEGSRIAQYDVGVGGKLSPKTPARVAAGNYPGAVVVSPDGASVYVTADDQATGGRVLQYDVDAHGALRAKTPNSVAAGSDAAGIAVTPDGQSVYVPNNGEGSAVVSQYDVGADGALSPKNPTTVAAVSGPEGIAVSPGIASVGVSGNTLVFTAAPGARDNVKVTHPLPGTLRVADLPSGLYTGSPIHAGPGCTLNGSYTAKCNAGGITRIRVMAGDLADRVVNSTGIRSSLYGGPGDDVLTGGWNDDTLIGGPGANVLKGTGGTNLVLARNGRSDKLIDCGVGGKAVLDPLPLDPNSIVKNCGTKTRH